MQGTEREQERRGRREGEEQAAETHSSLSSWLRDTDTSSPQPGGPSTLTVARSISGKSMGLMGQTSTDMGEFTTSDPPNEGTVRECSSNTSGEVEEEEVREDGPHPLSPADGEVAIRRSGGG